MDGLTPTSRSERYIANNFLGSFVAFEKKSTILDMPAFLYLCHFKNLLVTLPVFQATGRPPKLKENWEKP